MSIGGIWDVITMLGLTWDPAQFQDDGGYGHMKRVTVAGKTLPWWLAAHWAGINEVAGRALAAGGGVFSLPLTWDSGTAATDPGAGRLRAGGAVLSAATALHVSEADAGGASIAALLSQMIASNSVRKSQVRIGHRTDPTRWVMAFVTAGTDNGGWHSLTIAFAAGSSASPFADGDPVTLSFVAVGDAGSGAPAATETVAGIAELATQAEFDGRTEAGRIVVPAHLATGVELYGGSLTAAATLILPAVGTDFDVTGTSTIFAISSRTRGRQITLTFVDGLTLGHSSTLKMPDGIDMTVEAGGSLTLRALSVGWEVVTQKVRRASTSAHGLARLATQAVLDARTNATDAVTAALLAHGVGLTGTSITAGGTLTLPAIGDDFSVTGSGATITAISARTPAGRTVRTTMAGANTLVHSAALLLFTGTNIVTAAGDVIDWKSTPAGWAMIGYERADGSTLIPASLPSVLLRVETVSSAASIDFVSNIGSAYDDYYITFTGVTNTGGGGSFQIQVRVGGVWQTSNYSSAVQENRTGTITTSTTGILLTGSIAGNYSIGGKVYLYNLNASGVHKLVNGLLTTTFGGSVSTFVPGGAFVNFGDPVTGVRVNHTGGALAGTAKLFGVRKVVQSW